MKKNFLLFFALNGALCCLLGAFGSHALKSTLSTTMFQTYQTAVQYHFYHTLALGLACVFCFNKANIWLRTSMVGFSTGIVFFCGSLYILALTGIKVLGWLTPIGGLMFICSWLALATGLSKT